MLGIDGFKMGCGLCVEFQFPEVFSKYEQLEADGVLGSLFWMIQYFVAGPRLCGYK